MQVTTRHVDDLTEPGPPTTAPDVAVVIDVIRAFTVTPWCLARGAAQVLLAPSLDAAVEARRDRWPEALLLKDGPPDPRFELPNSPERVAGADLAGRTVIQKTGNGTRGAFAVGRVPLVLCASFATAGATARAIVRAAPDRVLLVPTEGDEDHALADYLTALLEDGGSRPDPASYLARVRESDAGRECRDRGEDPAYPGVDPGDLARCLELDAFDHAVRARPRAGLLGADRDEIDPATRKRSVRDHHYRGRSEAPPDTRRPRWTT